MAVGVIVFPILSSAIAALCTAVMARDAWRKPRPDKIVWTIAFALFALAAGIEVVGSATEWTELLARTYYATGVALVVVFLAAGQLFLLFPVQMKQFGFAVTLLVTALWISLVFGAPIDSSRLASDGWDAIERGPELKALGITLNAVGTLIIVGGSGWAVLRYWKTRTHQHRMVGCLLIMVGTLVVASGGSLERLGSDQLLYIAMAIGVAIIFGGVLVARTPDAVTAPAVSPAETGEASTAASLTAEPSAPAGQQSSDDLAASGVPGPVTADALAFIEHLLAQPEPDVARVCSEWSVPREDGAQLSRHEARRAWRLRSRLSPAAVTQFDRHTVAARRQLATLYFEVLTWERPPREEIAELVAPGEGVGFLRRGDQV
jgi:hypothetical protein